MSFAFGPPQGPAASSGSLGTVTATPATVTSSASTGTFTLANGTASGAYTLTVPVPAGATALIGVRVDSQSAAAVWATPLGYADGATASALAVWYYGEAWAAGGALALTTSSIVLPVPSASTIYYTTVLYA